MDLIFTDLNTTNKKIDIKKKLGKDTQKSIETQTEITQNKDKILK